MRRPRLPNTLQPKGEELPYTSVLNRPDEDPLRKFRVEVSEAERLVRQCRGRTLFVNVRQFAPSRDQANVTEGHERGIWVSANVPVSKRDALKFLDDAYSKLARERSMIELTICSNCFFIG